MGRAELRRMAKAQTKQTKTLNYTQGEIEKMLEDAFRHGWEESQKQQLHALSTDVTTMLLGLPLRVLSEKYGWGTRKKLPEFANYIIEYYTEFLNSGMKVDAYQEWVYENTGVKFVVEDDEND